MATGLEHLLAEGVISEVLARLQSGKEAEVYVVRFGGNVVAAKVYKDRATRSFKNNSSYKEGRAVRSSRSQRAMDRGSKFGKAAAEDAWKTAEADALYKLHAAEVRVPTPVLYLDGVLLMELVLDPHGNAARRLIDTALTPAEANAAYHDMVGQLVRILSCDLIHGDLSPYNVLWGAAGPVVIDFPQIVSASHNSSSEQFFLRDADNILGHFARIDNSLMSRRGDPREIWNAYRRRELSPDFRPTGQARPFYGGPPRPPMHDGSRGAQRNDQRPPQGDNRPPRGQGQSQAQAQAQAQRQPQGQGPSQGQAQRQPQGQGPSQGQAQRQPQGQGPSHGGGQRPRNPPGRPPPSGGGPRRPPMPEVIVRHAPGQASGAATPRGPVVEHVDHVAPAQPRAPRMNDRPPQVAPGGPTRGPSPRAADGTTGDGAENANGGEHARRRRRRRR